MASGKMTPPFFIADLPKILLFYSRICIPNNKVLNKSAKKRGSGHFSRVSPFHHISVYYERCFWPAIAAAAAETLAPAEADIEHQETEAATLAICRCRHIRLPVWHILHDVQVFSIYVLAAATTFIQVCSTIARYRLEDKCRRAVADE